MKIRLDANAKNKAKNFKDFKFCSFIGGSQVTSWQWKDHPQNQAKAVLKDRLSLVRRSISWKCSCSISSLLLSSNLHTLPYSLLCLRNPHPPTHLPHLLTAARLPHTSLSTVGFLTFSFFSPSTWNDRPLPLHSRNMIIWQQVDSLSQEEDTTAGGIPLWAPSNLSSYFFKTTDLPLFLFHAAIFLRHKPLHIIFQVGWKLCIQYTFAFSLDVHFNCNAYLWSASTNSLSSSSATVCPCEYLNL